MKVWSWRQAIEKAELKPMTKLVLYTLANYMNDHGTGCYPSIVTIAKACGLKERAIYNHISDAEKYGFLIRSKRNIAGQKWASNEYKASYPSYMTLDNSGSGNSVQEESTPQDVGVHHGAGVHEDAGKGCTTVHTNSPYNSPIDIKEKKYKKKENDLVSRFDEFWEQYGKIGNKQQAIKSYNKLIKGGTLHETIIGGVEKYQAYARANNTERKYIKHASTWLNNRGWEDDYPITSAGYSSKPTSRDYEEAAIRGMLRAENPDF